MSQGIYFLADERKRAVRRHAAKMELAVMLRPPRDKSQGSEPKSAEAD